MPPPYAPGFRSTFAGSGGQLALIWRLGSNTGGSVQCRLFAYLSQPQSRGDDLALVLRVGEASFYITRNRRRRVRIVTVAEDALTTRLGTKRPAS